MCNLDSSCITEETVFPSRSKHWLPINPAEGGTL